MFKKLRAYLSYIKLLIVIILPIILTLYIIFLIITLFNYHNIYEVNRDFILNLFVSFFSFLNNIIPDSIAGKKIGFIEHYSIFAVIILTIGVIFKVFVKKFLLLILSLPKKYVTNIKKIYFLLKKFIESFKNFKISENPDGVIRRNNYVYNYLLNIEDIPLKGENRAIFVGYILFLNGNLIESINKDLQKFINKSTYVYNYQKYGSNKEEVEVTSSIINKDTLLQNLRDNYKKFIDYNSSFNYDFKKVFGGVKIIKTMKISWISMGKENYNISKNQLLLGFYPLPSDNDILYSEYLLDYGEIGHSFIVGATRQGKDVLMLNIISSMLYNIKNYDNSIIHFIDSKGSDGTYLDGLKKYGVFRYKDSSKFTNIIGNIYKEVQERQKLLGVHSNIKEYNKFNPKNKKKELFLVVNELLSLSNKLDKKDSENLYQFLINILSEGASVGVHIILMSQTIRKDSNSRLGSALVNIQNYFALQVNGEDERNIIGKGLSFDDKEKLKKQIQYNCFHISESKIKKEFRAYNLNQKDILSWINQNFDKSNNFNSEKLNDYYSYVLENKTISRNQAFNEFGLTENEWRKIISKLKEKNLIEEIKGKGYIFKK